MTELLIKNARIVLNNKCESGDLLIQNGSITDISTNQQGASLTASKTIDASGGYLLPGFLDVHTHGAVGVDINGASPEDYLRLSLFFASQGVSGFLASILTDTQQQTERAIGAALSAKKDCPNLLGIHLEGPFLCCKYKGAMPEHLLVPADGALLRHYCNLAQGLVRYMTVSPETEGVQELIANAPQGVVMGIGHSDATYDQAMEAIKNGANLCTHTFNAMRLFHQHEPAIMGAVLESAIYCEAICDGRHLHPGSVRMLLKCKGWDKVIPVTDSIMATGLPDGQYKLGVNDVTVVDGDAKLTDSGVRAGSTLTAAQGFRNLISYTGASMAAVSRLLSQNPARLFGFQNKGCIRVGYDADLVLLDEELNVLLTLAGGQIIYQHEELLHETV